MPKLSRDRKNSSRKLTAPVPKAPVRSQPRPSGRKRVQSTSPAVIDDRLTTAALDKWLAHLGDVPNAPATAPLGVVLGEAALLGALYQEFWDAAPSPDGPEQPGFARIAEPSVLHEHTGHELLELVTAIAKIDAQYDRAKQSLGAFPMRRAEAVLREIKAALEFLFDDGEHTRADDQLKKVSKTHPRPTSHADMSLALGAFVGLADEHARELRQVATFDFALLDEARNLAAAAMERPGEIQLAVIRSGSEDLIATRNRLIDLLRDRVNRVRRAARYLFRDHPDIARKFASDYQRARRREHRKKPGEAGPGRTKDAGSGLREA